MAMGLMVVDLAEVTNAQNVVHQWSKLVNYKLVQDSLSAKESLIIVLKIRRRFFPIQNLFLKVIYFKWLNFCFKMVQQNDFNKTRTGPNF